MIQSMTAFTRISDQGDWGSATLEIKAVNHRYFDCVFKVPEAFRQLESDIKLRMQKKLGRGRVECSLKFNRDGQSGSNFVVNQELVKKIMDAVGEVKSFLPISQIDPMKILSWPQVLQTAEEDFTPAQEKIMQMFESALSDLIATREREGAALAEIMKGKLQEMLSIVGKVKEKMPQIMDNHRQKIVKKLEEVTSSLDQTRLEQEMVYAAQKIDIAEEIERLETHIKEVIRILGEGGTAGKRLDFLMQELNREANTLSSKSIDIETTQYAVDLKVFIEQMREQVQNIV